MAEKMIEALEVPAGMQVELTGNNLKVSASGKNNARHFRSTGIALRKTGLKIEVWAKTSRRSTLAEGRSVSSHIKNMIAGIAKPYEYRLEIVYSHFPLNVTVKDRVVEIYNLGGAKHPRKAKIVGDTKVTVKGKDILVSGQSKEATGQTAANMEQATKIKGKDMRVFQDGIYITAKPKANER